MKVTSKTSLKKQNKLTKKSAAPKTKSPAPSSKSGKTSRSGPTDKVKLSKESRQMDSDGAKPNLLKGLTEAYSTETDSKDSTEGKPRTEAKNQTEVPKSKEPGAAKEDNQKKGPVVTIISHGYGSNPEKMKRLADGLVKKGIGKDGGVVTVKDLKNIDPKGEVFRLGYSAPKGAGLEKVDQKEMAKMIAAIQKSTGASRINFVGHSRGGRLGLAALQNDKNLKFGKMVLLGSPVQGAKRAADPDTNRTIQSLKPHAAKGIESLRPGSPETKQIQNGDYRGRADITSVAGRGAITPGAKDGDGVVSPEETRVPGAKHVDAHNCSHISLSSDPAIVDFVADTLKGKPVNPENSLTCRHGVTDGDYWKNFAGNVIDGIHTAVDRVSRVTSGLMAAAF